MKVPALAVSVITLLCVLVQEFTGLCYRLVPLHPAPFVYSSAPAPRSFIPAPRPAGRRSLNLFMKKKGGRVLVTLECTEARALGMPPSRYITSKNRRTTPEPLVLRKYNKYLRRHTIHKEIK
ncbi:hypothetical protein BESB_001240 [Besnoitia besnoiti]|uniref:50S ribosomal protein L33 n=1 Tax=Besnoitia besnoiti TaxID=94643 RepID=A0A2A9MPM8_BESBE|nr:hypothetical protein BESB_001240 [Besnoitia besnoiti]PFH37782.1 hypothetical protein BESB_001240 [Besnoitia besnoiti]